MFAKLKDKLARFEMNKIFYFRGRKIFRVSFSRAYWKRPKIWVLTVDFGYGAGYVGGRSLYLARRCPSSTYARYRKFFPKRAYGRYAVQFGFTGNANAIPLPLG